MQCGERGAVAAQREQEVTGVGVDRLGDSAGLPMDRDLAYRHTLPRRPIAQAAKRPVDVPARVYDDSDLLRGAH